MDIKKKVNRLPNSAGVYLMKDKANEIIYIGKAASLKKRVASYFIKRPLSERLGALVNNIKDIDYIQTTNEAEALLLESALIKSNKPKYNVALRDDKNYPLLKLSMNEKFPRLLITRKRLNDQARYFGPFTEAKLLRQALVFLKRIFPLRTCRAMPKKVCLNYYLRQCVAPCVDKASKNEYNEIAKQLTMFLEGKRPELIKELEKKMFLASKDKRYEEAGRIRDQIAALSSAVLTPKNGADVTAQLEALKEALSLKNQPQRIEAFDVSNISGSEAAGSMVTFLKGWPYKSAYKKFKIREVRGIDDYQMMREIIRRRYQNLIEKKETPPDLIIIDGGKGHLSSVKEELNKMGLDNIPVMAIAKEFEHIFLPGKPEPIRFPESSLVLYLLQRIRDEAHRFAIGYHKTLRGKLTSISALDNIRGIGPKKKTALIKHFGSVGGIKKATKSDLLHIKGITDVLAAQILQEVRK